MAIRLGTPRLRVVITPQSDDAVEVQTIGADMVLAEEQGRRHKWGPMTESPMTWLSCLAWAALKRDGLLGADVTLAAFRANLGSIDDATDEEDDETGTPTRPGPEPG